MTMEQEFEALDQFPVGMRVLAVDDDQTCLRILKTLLHHCQYHVTTTNQAQTALELLRENKNKFDLVISDVDMPDMDGFKLLELVGLEMDLPVIMLSAHSDPKYVMKGVTHGACDYLLKPVRIEELKNIWQHVVRKGKLQKKKMKQSSYVSNGESAENYDHNGVKANRKRKDQFEEEAEEEDRANENDDPTAQKKPRVVWTPELHKKFIGAVDHLGLEQAVPKKILDLMNVDKLTRENVASHLQKFRSALKKLTCQANQQANMAVANSHYMQMGSLNGFHHHRSIPFGSGQFHGGAATMRHYPSNGILGRLNSPAGMFQHASSLPFSNNNGRNILQGLPISPLEELKINNNNNNNNNNAAFPIFTSQQSSLMVAPNNHLVLEGNPQSSSPGFSPHFEMNNHRQQWSNAVLSTNIPQSDVHSKPDTLEWNLICDSASPLIDSNLDANPTTFCGNTGFGSSNAAQTDFFDLLEMNQQPANNSGPVTDAQLLSSSNLKEGLLMGQQKLQNGFMASDAGSLDDIVNSMMTQEQSQSEFSVGDMGCGWLSSLGTCI